MATHERHDHERGDPVRRDRLREVMRTAGLDAILAAGASEVLLLSGYWPVFSTSVAMFTADGQCHVIVPEDEQDLAAQTSDAHLIPYSPGSRGKITGPIVQLREPLQGLLARLKLGHAKVGMALEIGEQPAPYAVLTEFRSSLRTLFGELAPHVTLVGVDDLLETEKAVKTPRELSLIRKTVQVAREGFASAEAAIQAGRREAEIAADVQKAFQSSPAAEALERSYGFFFCMSGPNSAEAAAAYARTRQRRVMEGDLVMIHANTCGDGFWTDITRTFTVGAPQPRHDQMRTAIDAARQAALAATKPGARGADVDAAARAVMTAHGYGEAFLHGTGHGVGYAAASANALPRIHAESPDVLEAGMTFNVEPAAYFDGYGGMRHCDVVSVTDTGVEVLTDF